MALDSRQKRAAVIGVGRAWYRNPHPSGLDESQRASVGQAYPVSSFVIIAFGGIYNAVAGFPTGQSDVIIALYDPITNAVISLTTDACLEMETSGRYIWDASKLSAQPVGYQEYVWEMTDGVTIEEGVIRMFDQSSVATLNRIEEFLRNERVTDPETGTQTVMDALGDPKYRGNLYQDVAKTIPYQGDGANVAERLEDV